MALLPLVLLIPVGCSDAQITWSEGEIADIAYDAAVDAIADTEVSEVSGGDFESRIVDLEQQISDQALRIDSLEAELASARREISYLELRR